MTTPPGWYHAQGDPDGTVRYWNGTEWSAEPMPPPPGWSDPYTAVPASGRFAGAGIRVGAIVIDTIIVVLAVLPFMFGYIGDVIDDVDAGGDGSGVPLPDGVYIVALLLSVGYFLMVAFLAGTPGKLALGLRITHDDGRTTPPGLGKAFLRNIPGFLGALPGIGQIIVVVVPIASLIMVLNDRDERRSVYDRIAGTRVVHKSSLPD